MHNFKFVFTKKKKTITITVLYLCLYFIEILSTFFKSRQLKCQTPSRRPIHLKKTARIVSLVSEMQLTSKFSMNHRCSSSMGALLIVCCALNISPNCSVRVTVVGQMDKWEIQFFTLFLTPSIWSGTSQRNQVSVG